LLPCQWLEAHAAVQSIGTAEILSFAVVALCMVDRSNGKARSGHGNLGITVAAIAAITATLGYATKMMPTNVARSSVLPRMLWGRLPQPKSALRAAHAILGNWVTTVGNESVLATNICG
jgi:hypothetical protein